ncbi:unnamed protein product [Amoebophrya sp. A25]|nr:unnamed protein product [Amoebophrya sp. A25]|eukprot:GSA25T00004595001.1
MRVLNASRLHNSRPATTPLQDTIVRGYDCKLLCTHTHDHKDKHN